MQVLMKNSQNDLLTLVQRILSVYTDQHKQIRGSELYIISGVRAVIRHSQQRRGLVLVTSVKVFANVSSHDMICL